MSKNFSLRQGRKKRFILLCEVMFLKAKGRNTEFVLCDETGKVEKERIISSYNLGHYIDESPGSKLAQTHRSYIVNTDIVQSINDDNTLGLRVKTKEVIPLSKRFRSPFRKRMEE